jgi:hypothetical protein
MAQPVNPGAFSGGVWLTCSEHFTPGESARTDATRLALSCGPSTGLLRFAKTAGTLDDTKEPVLFRWEAKKRDCFRVFAAAAAPIEDLEIEIIGPHGARVALANRNERWEAAPEEGPACAERDGTFEVRFGTHAGRGDFFAWIYRAEAMVEKKQKAGHVPPASSR